MIPGNYNPNMNNSVVRVGWRIFLFEFVSLLAGLGFGTFYSMSYYSLADNARNYITSKWLLAYILFAWCNTIIHGLKIITILLNFDKNILAHVWNRMQPENIFPVSLLKLSRPGILITGIYFIFHNNCDAYETVTGGYNVCLSMSIIMVVTICKLICIGIFLQLCCCAGCYFGSYHDNVNIEGESQIRSNILFAQNYLLSYNPISLPENDTVCAICLMSVEENSTLDWTSLECGHIFHIKCITEWMKCNRTCPFCRIEITLNNNNEPMV
jgi:hypothetical protein